MELSKPPQVSSSPEPMASADASAGAIYLSRSLAQAAQAVMDDLCWLVSSGCCVDEHTADQLLLYMAHAPGRSSIKCAPAGSASSLHIATVVQIMGDMDGVSFEINTTGEGEGESDRYRIIKCSENNPASNDKAVTAKQLPCRLNRFLSM